MIRRILVCIVVSCALVLGQDTVSPTTTSPTTTSPTTSVPTTTTPTTKPPTTATPTTLSPSVLPSVIPSPPPTESPSVESSEMLDELGDSTRRLWQASILDGIVYPFQTDLTLADPIPAFYVNVTNNATTLVIETTFLRRSNPGQIPPNFNLPLNNTIITARLQTLPCVPEQGGFYYRDNISIDFGNVDNEVVVTRATDNIGGYVVSAERPFQVRPEDANSIVLYSADQGLVMCANVEWNLVDGAISSFISVLTLSIAFLFIVKRTLFRGNVVDS